jgi:hypothetical protein
MKNMEDPMPKQTLEGIPHDVKRTLISHIQYYSISSGKIGEAVLAIAETFDFQDEVNVLGVNHDDTKESIIAKALQMIEDFDETIREAISVFGSDESSKILLADKVKLEKFVIWLQQAL